MVVFPSTMQINNEILYDFTDLTTLQTLQT